MKPVRAHRYALLPLLVVMMLAVVAPSPAPAADLTEYQVKAAVLFRMLHFTQWPEEAFSGDPGRITLGVVGPDPFGDAFTAVEGETVVGRRLTVKRFTDAADPGINECQALFVSPELPQREALRLLEDLQGRPVLTVGDLEWFTARGGIVGLLLKGGRVTFEINTGAADAAGIRFRSQLLRLASRLVGGSR